ncbi:MAG TPA: NAD(P)H-binding protein [Anaerolineaceae bacterium]
MVLVTGGTGFVGQALIRQLVDSGQQVRLLIRPSKKSPTLPHGIPVDVTLCSLQDERGLQAAMGGIDTVYHLASSEGRGNQADLLTVDIQGTKNVAAAAASSGVRRIFYLSHIGADRASAFPVLKAKAIAEHYIRNSGVGYTIFRSGVVFGEGDRFTTNLARLLRSFPFICLIPGDGKTLLQPLWVEDLTTSLVWALDDGATVNQVYTVGGPEYLSYRQILETVMSVSGTHRAVVSISPVTMRGITVFSEETLPRFPLNIFWLDYLALDRTGPVDTLPRIFGLIPSSFAQRLDHLRPRGHHREIRPQIQAL